MDEPAPATPDDGLTVRERRAQRAKKSARAALPGQVARKAIVPAIVILVLAGVAAGFYFTATNQPDCPGHWHASFQVRVDGQRVPFSNPAYQNPPGGAHDYHLHGDDGILHYHPAAPRCVPLEDMMSRLGVQPSANKVILDASHAATGFDGTYEESSNKTVLYFHQPHGKEWREVSWSSIDGKQLGNGDKWLVYYGPDDQAQIDAAKLAVADLPANYRPN